MQIKIILRILLRYCKIFVRLNYGLVKKILLQYEYSLNDLQVSYII